MKTGNLSADNFKKILDLNGSAPEPAIRSGDTVQPCLDSCQLVTTLMCNMCAICLPELPNQLESVILNIGCPVVRKDERAVYCHVITKFSGIGRFTCHGAPQARFARQSSAINVWRVCQTRVYKSLIGNLARHSFSLFDRNKTQPQTSKTSEQRLAYH